MTMTRAELQRMPERPWLKTDVDVRIIGFCPFGDYSGGYLVYAIRAQKYKQFIGSSMARKMGIREINVFSVRHALVQESKIPVNVKPNIPVPETQKYTFPTREDLRREIGGAIMAAPMMRKIFRRHSVTI